MNPPATLSSTQWIATPVAPARIGQYPLPNDAPLLNLAEPGAASESEFLRRDELADRLALYNAGVGNPLSSATLSAIRGEGVFIIAGQQPGLLLGPMYTLLKAATAIALAKRLAPRVKAPIIPAFWIASEDHDVEEVNHCVVNGKTISLPHRAALHAPVGQISLESHKAAIIQQFTDAVAGSPHGSWVTELIRSARFDNYADSFAALLAKLLPGSLVLIDPLHLRPLTAPVMVHLMSCWNELSAALKQGGTTLRRWGFSPPLDKLTVFRIAGGHRTPVDPADTANPEQLSPSAGLRPIVQDAIIPTLATIGGPTELHYLWQIDPLYAVAGVKRSRIRSRLGATFVDDTVVRRAARFDLVGERLLDVQKELQRYDARGNADATDPDLSEIEKLGKELLTRIESAAGPAHAKQIAKSQKSIAYQLGKVSRRIREQRDESAGAGRRNLTRVADTIYPGGKLQERVISPFDMLARYGPAWLDSLIRNLDQERGTHWLVQLQDSATPQQGESA